MGTARAWGWVMHLRDGGTTPWLAWSGEAPPIARVLPGAQQLELLRTLNRAGNNDARLADRVLAAPAPGRGKPDLALVGVASSPYGPQPVDPAQLPVDELIRVATSVLAEDVVALGPSAPTPRLRRGWRRGCRLAGDPLDVAQVRDHLTGRGRSPGGAGTTTVILGGPLEEMLVDVWSRRCFERGSGGWLAWLRFWQQRDDLPPRIDLPSVAERHLARHERVTVVFDRSRLPALVGVRRLPPLVRPGADAAELSRRIASVMGLLVPPQERAALMTRTLLPRMPVTGTPPVALPNEHREWVRVAAERMARQLSRAGYPVVGDPASLVPTGSAAPDAPSAASGQLVLDLAVRMLVDDTWKGL
ncbi:hypothetical protein [Nocardioides sp.]|uniref:hypothetical protein n=1 Tax=Nocardioides sp. TaxID=35761 RepID=UPI00286D93FF|nr:hypothetical protein [Nocardioides sp.]